MSSPRSRTITISELWVAAYALVFLLIGLLIVWSVEKPQPANDGCNPEHDQHASREVESPRVPAELEVVADAFLVRVVDPLAHADESGAEKYQHERVAQLRVIGDCRRADHGRDGEHGQRAIPQVKSSVFEIHGPLPSHEGSSVAPPQS